MKTEGIESNNLVSEDPVVKDITKDIYCTENYVVSA